MSFAVAWMNLEITILSEVRQTEKVKSFAISHVESFFFFNMERFTNLRVILAQGPC